MSNKIFKHCSIIYVQSFKTVKILYWCKFNLARVCFRTILSLELPHSLPYLLSVGREMLVLFRLLFSTQFISTSVMFGSVVFFHYYQKVRSNWECLKWIPTTILPNLFVMDEWTYYTCHTLAQTMLLIPWTKLLCKKIGGVFYTAIYSFIWLA